MSKVDSSVVKEQSLLASNGLVTSTIYCLNVQKAGELMSCDYSLNVWKLRNDAGPCTMGSTDALALVPMRPAEWPGRGSSQTGKRHHSYRSVSWMEKLGFRKTWDPFHQCSAMESLVETTSNITNHSGLDQLPTNRFIQDTQNFTPRNTSLVRDVMQM